MQIRAGISLGLIPLFVPTIVLFTIFPAKAQSGELSEDFDPHFYCYGLARERAERLSSSNAAGNVVGGAARGAASGAIIGAISGDAGRGAGIGAAMGGLGGSSRTLDNRDAIFRREYDACMRSNGR